MEKNIYIGIGEKHIFTVDINDLFCTRKKYKMKKPYTNLLSKCINEISFVSKKHIKISCILNC